MVPKYFERNKYHLRILWNLLKIVNRQYSKNPYFFKKNIGIRMILCHCSPCVLYYVLLEIDNQQQKLLCGNFFFLLIWLSKDLLNISRPASSLPTSPPSAFEPFVIRENECIQSGGTKIPATTIAHLPHYRRRRFYWVNPRKPYRSFQNTTCWDLDYRASPMGLFAQWSQQILNVQISF